MVLNVGADGDACADKDYDAPRVKVNHDQDVPEDPTETAESKGPAFAAEGIRIREAKPIHRALAALDSEWK